MIFLVSDTHFGDERIITYARRPFGNSEQMDLCMLERWRDRVERGDTVIHLGDFSMHGGDRTREILSLLPGRKVLISGNHDLSRERMLSLGFDEVRAYMHLRGRRRYLLTHSPRSSRVRRYLGGGGWVLHGHTHTNTPPLSPKSRGSLINLSCEWWGYSPVPLNEMERLLGI